MNEVISPVRTAPRAIAPSPLEATRMHVDIHDLLATITLEQRYKNQEAQAIEVSYTLALPADAALLDVEVEINGQRLRGAVQPRIEAEMRYERALADGHSAFSIRMVGDQLVNIALGNLKPGEHLHLRIVMAQWLMWNGDRVRLTLPTTIAPRYGNCLLEPSDAPSVDLLAEHAFVLSGSVRGLLAFAQLSSATHALLTRASADGIGFSIENGHLNRDIVIDLRETAAPLRVSATTAADSDGRQVAMLTFCASNNASKLRPVVAEFVIDCSGSMAGVSIEQTRAALRAIVAQLDPADYVNVLRFGSSHVSTLRRPQAATVAVQRTLLDSAEQMQADLGGTELLSALNAGLDDLARLPATIGGERVLFIISDGEVWNVDFSDFLSRCARDCVKVFAVAVGSAAVETTFAPLTKASGGALERVLPSDTMAARIQRHFERVRSGALREIEVHWAAATDWTRGPSEFYPGDGAIFSAGLVPKPATTSATSHSESASMLRVSWLEPNGDRRESTLPLARAPSADVASPSVIARMLARSRIGELTDVATATQMAVDYQLITQHSAITLILERAEHEQLDRLPPLRVVQQMLPEGWGGTSSATSPMCAALMRPALSKRPSVQWGGGVVDTGSHFGTIVREERVGHGPPSPRDVRAFSHPAPISKRVSMSKPKGANSEVSRCTDEDSFAISLTASWLQTRVFQQLKDNVDHLSAAREQRLTLADLILHLSADEIAELHALAQTENLTWDSAGFLQWLLAQWAFDAAGEPIWTLLRG